MARNLMSKRFMWWLARRLLILGRTKQQHAVAYLEDAGAASLRDLQQLPVGRGGRYLVALIEQRPRTIA